MDRLPKGATLLASAALPIELHFLLDVAPLIAFSLVEILHAPSLISEPLFQSS
jgi:hypothetical protein